MVYFYRQLDHIHRKWIYKVIQLIEIITDGGI